MYKCLECGHLFDDGEQTEWVESHGEQFSGCPICHGAYAETKHCVKCKENFLPDELKNGVCHECISAAINYDNALAYMEDHGHLDLFMFEWVYDTSVPAQVSEKLHKTMRELFLRMKANDLLCDETTLLDLCRKFIEDDEDDFADWIKERKEMKK